MVYFNQMKTKFFAFLLILVLLTPAVGMCDCCPKAALSAQTAFSNIPHHCCPTLDVNRDNCRIEKQNSVVVTSSESGRLNLFSDASVFQTDLVSHFSSRTSDTSPPLFSSKTPLYLLNQVLRF